MRRAIFYLGGLSIMLTGGFMFAVGEPNQLGWWALALSVLLWNMAPFLVCFALARWVFKQNYQLVVMLITTIAIAVLNVLALYAAFILDPKKLSGLVFLLLPFYQAGIILLGLGVMGIKKIIDIIGFYVRD